MDIFGDLEKRGLLDQFSDEKKIRELLSSPHTIYCGFDPSAKSLQLGNFIMISILQRLQKAGHRVIAVLGGGTGMIGDPSGKKAERKFLDRDAIFANANAIKNQLSKYIDTTDPKKGLIVNNYDWWSKIDVLTFLRDYGKNFQINMMLDKDVIKNRLEAGISYAEFSYMLLQSGDFARLYEKEGCNIQIGGGDQWGNLTSSLDFVKRRFGPDTPCEVFTFKLITDSNGKKFGKSENGALYLDPELTSPYRLYQYFMNVSDLDVRRYLYIFDSRPVEEIDKLYAAHMEHPELRQGQKELARVIVTAVHGEKAAEVCKTMSEALFKNDFKGLDSKELLELTDGLVIANETEDISLLDALVLTKLAQSKREAREFVKNGAVLVNGEKVTDLDAVIKKEEALDGGFIFLRRGKKNYAVLKY